MSRTKWTEQLTQLTQLTKSLFKIKMTLPKCLSKKSWGPHPESKATPGHLDGSTLESQAIDTLLACQQRYISKFSLDMSSTECSCFQARYSYFKRKGNWAAIVLQLTNFPSQLIMMVPQFRFESTPLPEQHVLFFVIKSKRNHTHPLLE